MGAAKYNVMKGDRVRVIRGNHRDMEGTVLEVLLDVGRVRVEGVKMRKRHTRPTQDNPDGGIITFEAPIDVSNVMLYNPQTKKGDRVGFRSLEDGRKVRFFKSTDEVVDI